MRINNEYELRVKVITKDSSDCCDLAELAPETPYDFVYIVIETSTGFIPDDWEVDWFESPEDAISDYYKNKNLEG
jgi:hypothetical protein